MLDWDHNAYYHRLLLGLLPPDSRRVLDLGCGAGAFAARLARRVDVVDALDRSPTMIDEARRRTPATVDCRLADALVDPLPADTYDAIFSISALHHMPLPEILPRLAESLRPGGILAAVALPKADPARELPQELAAAAAHRAFGAAFLAARTLGVGSGDWFARDAGHSSMPVVMDPELTTREVDRQARALLPGAQVRRLIFWRYLLLWRRHPEITPGSARSDP